MKGIISPTLKKMKFASVTFSVLLWAFVLVLMLPKALKIPLDFSANFPYYSALADFLSAEPERLIGLLALFFISYQLTQTIDKYIRTEIIIYIIKRLGQTK